MGPAAGSRPRVDVGVVTWNSAELTVQALRHLLDTDQGCDLRLLVHENGSEDGTAARIKEAVPEAEVAECPDNLGFARGVNRLLERSDAPWFWALNSDAWPEPGALARLVATLEAHPQAAAASPLLLRPDGTVEHGTHPFPSLAVAALEATGGRHWAPRSWRERLALEGAWSHDRPRAVDWAVGAALLLRRQAVDALGGLDERFFMYVEDLEWCWRAARAGWEVRFEPTAVVRHVGNASGARRFGDARIALEAANLNLLLEETLGRRRARAYRALQAVACTERAVVARVRGRRGDEGLARVQAKAALGLLAPPSVAHPVPPVAPSSSTTTSVAVVVPTHGRADRLTRLVRALEKQTLPADRFEVVVVDDCSPDDTAAVLDDLVTTSPLRLHVLRQSQRSGPAAARNRGWRDSDAPVIAFTDDDCVPEPEWLEQGLGAMADSARLVVGRTLPPDDQLALTRQPFSRAMVVDSARFFETCNVFYRRVDLEAAGGFDERFRRPSGEDTRLGLSVTDLGVTPVYAVDAVVRHDVRPGDLSATLRETLRWVDLPLVLKGRPTARPSLTHRWIFWKPTHPPAILAALGLALGARWRLALLLCLPWLAHRLRTAPLAPDPVRRVAALPGGLVLDLTEVAVMARGSLRHRTLLL